MAVQIEFVSAKTLEGKASGEKLKLVIEAVKKNKIVVLETPLSREDEKELIRQTMELISNKFTGIEISSFGEQAEDLRAKLIKLLGGKTYGLTIIGPSKLVKQIKRQPDKLNLFAGK
ncbi:MAG: DUF2073 domain-containing protein [Candidatus Micrarchaeia archaeon]